MSSKFTVMQPSPSNCLGFAPSCISNIYKEKNKYPVNE